MHQPFCCPHTATCTQTFKSQKRRTYHVNTQHQSSHRARRQSPLPVQPATPQQDNGVIDNDIPDHRDSPSASPAPTSSHKAHPYLTGMHNFYTLHHYISIDDFQEYHATLTETPFPQIPHHPQDLILKETGPLSKMPWSSGLLNFSIAKLRWQLAKLMS